jgi:hypothetical protein
MSQIMEQSPAYISYRYDTITISQVAGESFTFTTYSITDVGGNTFTALTSLDTSDIVAAKTQEIYRLLVTSIFKGCCECGNTEPECSIQYTAGTDPTIAGTLWDVGGVGMRINYFTANSQDFTGFWPIIQDGSWIFVFSKTDPTVYGVYQLSNYTDGGTFAQFASTLLAGPAGFPDGTELCVDVTSVGGSLVQGWQDTLDINSTLDKDNTVDGAGFDFVFDNNSSFTINSVGGSIQTSVSGASLISGALSIDVAPGYIDIITPGYGAATTGMVLALDSFGHVEYTLAGTGTISSIGLFMPSAFTVSTPNPLTSNGDFTVTGAGTDLEYINGLGELATLPVYTVDNGLHTQESPADPFVFHLGGQLIEDTLIETTEGASPGPVNEWQLAVRGSADQDTRFPFGVANLGNGGVATFQDYGSGSRPHASVEIVGDVDLLQPLLELNMEGNLPTADDTLLRLRYSGDPSLAMMTIDYQFRNNNVVVASSNFIGSRLSTEVVSFVDGNEETRFEVQLVDNGTLSNKLELQGFGQLVLNEYATSAFSNSASNINNDLEYVLAVDTSGNVFKKLSEGGGTVTSVTATGLLTTSPDPIEITGVVTSEMDSGFLVGRYSSGTGVFEQIVIGSGLTLTGDTLTADGGTGFDVQVNTTTIIPPATILNLKSGTDINVIHEGSGDVRFDWVGTPSNQGLQDVIIVDNVLTQNNTIQGSITSFVWQSNSFYEINPTVNYDPGTGTVPGYFKAWVGKYPPSYSELYVEAIYAQMKSEGATDQIVKVDTTGVYVQTPGLGSATVGQVLTLQNATTGQVEYQDAGGGTYTVNNGLTENPTDNFQLGGPLVQNTTINGATNAFDLNIYDLKYFDTTSSDGYQFTAGLGTSQGYLNIAPNYFYAEAYDATDNSNLLFASGVTQLQASQNLILGGGTTQLTASTDLTIAGEQNTIFTSALSPTGTTITAGDPSAEQSSIYVGRLAGTGFSTIPTIKINTPNVDNGTAVVGQVLKLKSMTGSEAGRVEFEDGGGGLKSGNAIQGPPGEYTATISGVTAYTAGEAFMIKFDSTNEGASTLDINSLGPIDIFKNTNVKISSGDIKTDQEIMVVYDGTNFQAIGLVTNQLLAYVHNSEAAPITKGQVVYAFGASGDRMSVKLALANADATSAKTIGMVYDSSIAAGGEGYIIIQGVIEGINTSTFAAGAILYLSGTTPGGYTSTPTYAPTHRVYVGVVEKSNPGNGQIYVRCQNGYELDELHDVQAQSPNDNDTLYFDSADSQWKTGTVPSLSGTFSIGITVDGSGGVVTAGQKGYVRVPYACTITSWSILTGNAGLGATVTFDIWRANNAIPTVANSLVGGGTKPFLTSATQQITSAAPTGWTSVTLAANDILGFNVESGAAVFSWVNLQLLVTKI